MQCPAILLEIGILTTCTFLVLFIRKMFHCAVHVYINDVRKLYKCFLHSRIQKLIELCKLCSDFKIILLDGMVFKSLYLMITLISQGTYKRILWHIMCFRNYKVCTISQCGCRRNIHVYSFRCLDIRILWSVVSK